MSMTTTQSAPTAQRDSMGGRRLSVHAPAPPASKEGIITTTNAHDSGFGDDIVPDDYIRQRIEKMKNMMSLPVHEKEKESHKILLLKEIGKSKSLLLRSRGDSACSLYANEKPRKDRCGNSVDNGELSRMVQGNGKQDAAKKYEDQIQLSDKNKQVGEIEEEYKTSRIHPNISQSQLSKWEHATHLEISTTNTYRILWECGLLGLLFKANNEGRPVIRRVSKRGSSQGRAQARVGDMLVAMNGISVRETSFQDVVERLRDASFPVELEFARNSEAIRSSDGYTETLSTPTSEFTKANEPSAAQSKSTADMELEYDVIWRSGSLGCGLKNRDGIPCVKKDSNGTNESLVDAAAKTIRHGDVLLMINDQKTNTLGFKGSISLLQNALKPVHLRFRRQSSEISPGPASAVIPGPAISDDTLDASPLSNIKLSPNQYAVVWKKGSLGINIRSRSVDGAVVISEITQVGPHTQQFTVGDIFRRVAGFEPPVTGVVAVVELLKSVQKPAVLVFEKCPPSQYDDGEYEKAATVSSHLSHLDERGSPSSMGQTFNSSVMVSSKPLSRDPVSLLGNLKNSTNGSLGNLDSCTDESGARFSAKSATRLSSYSERFSQAKPDVYELIQDRSPRLSENEEVSLTTSQTGCDLPPIAENSKPDANGKTIPRYSYDVKTSQKEKQSFSLNNTHMSSYSDLDDSGVVSARSGTTGSTPPAVLPPKLWITWSEGPLGITFRRMHSQIVVSRLTGAGYSKGIDQLRNGDILFSLNNQYFMEDLSLTEAMDLLKALPKPVDLCFNLQ